MEHDMEIAYNTDRKSAYSGFSPSRHVKSCIAPASGAGNGFTAVTGLRSIGRVLAKR